MGGIMHALARGGNMILQGEGSWEGSCMILQGEVI